MSDPRRILDGGGSEIARSLIESAADEAPSREAVARALVAVAAGGAVTATAASAGAATAATRLGAPVMALLKWLGIGATGAALTVTAVNVMDSRQAREHTPATGAIAPATPGSTALPASTVRAEASADAPVPAASASAAGAVSPPTRRTIPSAPTIASAPAQGVYAEVDTLDRARHSMASGDSEAALRTLREYEQRFPHGQLGPEGLAMRMEAQLAAGDQRAAVESAQRLIAASPGSPHATRAREVIRRAVINAGPGRD